MKPLRKLIQEVHRRSLWQVLGIYLVGSWAAYQGILALVEGFGLPAWVTPFAGVLFLIGLPIVLATAVVQEGGPAPRELLGDPRRGDALEPHPLAADGAAGADASGLSWLAGFLTWRRSLLAGAAAFLLLALGATGYTGMRVAGVGPVGTLMAKGVLEADDPIVLADFTAPEDDPALGRAVGEALRIDLIESRVVELVDDDVVRSTLALMGAEPGAPLSERQAREVALREGLKAVLAGEVAGLGASYVITARLLSPEDGKVLVAFRETARDSSRLIDAVDRLSKRVRERVGEPLRSLNSAAPLWRVSTASLPALRRYSEAMRIMDEEGDVLEATDVLEEAVAVDSTFGMAWRKLGTYLGNMGIRRERELEALTRAHQLRDRLPELEAYQAEGIYHQRVTRDDAAAMGAYRSALARSPDDEVSLNNLALYRYRFRQYAEAEELLRRAIELPRAGHYQYGNLAEAVYAQGRSEEARRILEQGRARFPGNVGAHLYLVDLLSAEGRRSSADSLLDWIQDSVAREPSPPVLLNGRSNALAQGRISGWEDATRRLRDFAAARDLRRQLYQVEHDRAWLSLVVRQDTGRALRELGDALDRHPPGSFRGAEHPGLDIALFLATVGRPDSAEAMLREWERAVPEVERAGNRFRATVQAYIAAGRGRPQALLEDARAQHAGATCRLCLLLDRALAFEGLEEPDSAIAAWTGYLDEKTMFRNDMDELWLPLAFERLAELHHARGDVEQAARYYTRFLELWKDADPELQPRVRRVRQLLESLGRAEGVGLAGGD